MSIVGLFYNFIFLCFIVPIFILTLIGRPRFLMKIISKIIHTTVNEHEIFTYLLLLCIIFASYFYYQFYRSQSLIQVLLTHNDQVSELESKRLTARSNQRNFYIFIVAFAMLLAIHKFTERFIRIGEIENELKSKKEELDKLVPQKTETDKKND
jgi:hypothetical protein